MIKTIIAFASFWLPRLTTKLRQPQPAPAMNEIMREHRRLQNAEHNQLDRNIGWN